MLIPVCFLFFRCSPSLLPETLLEYGLIVWVLIISPVEHVEILGMFLNCGGQVSFLKRFVYSITCDFDYVYIYIYVCKIV